MFNKVMKKSNTTEKQLRKNVSDIDKLYKLVTQTEEIKRKIGMLHIDMENEISKIELEYSRKEIDLLKDEALNDAV